MNIGKAIKFCRTRKEMSQMKLSSKANISVSYFSLLENNKRNPNLSTIQKISFALEIPVFLLIFIASDDNELLEINSKLVEKLSYTVLEQLK